MYGQPFIPNFSHKKALREGIENPFIEAPTRIPTAFDGGRAPNHFHKKQQIRHKINYPRNSGEHQPRSQFLRIFSQSFHNRTQQVLLGEKIREKRAN